MNEELNPITREEMFLAKASGQNTPELTPITRVERFLQNLIDHVKSIGTGGGGGGNAGGGGADLLNENGVIKQQYLPDGFPYKEGEVKAILSDAKPVDMDGTPILLDEVNLSVGEEYTVTWNGVEYKSVCFVYGIPEEYYHVLGNPFAWGGENNNQPFAIAAVPPEFASEEVGFGAMVIPLDGSTDITISITGFVGTIQKIDEKYLPDTSDTFVVEVTTKGAGYGTNKSSQEIITAAAQGKIIVLKMFNRSTSVIQYFTYTGSSSGYAGFSRTSVSQGGVDFEGISIYDYNVTLTHKTYDKLD